MARARAIETRLEKLVPALDEYYSSGFLTREETLEVSRQRTHWEYRLVAKPLLLLDVRGAITYELGLEKRLREYCIHTKLNLQHRWDILERIEGIYKIGIKHLKNRKEHEALRQEYVLFLKQFQRNGSLSNLYGELMVTYPRRSDIWVEAAEWQCVSQHNTDNARAIVQQALLTMASDPLVWACALRVELLFVQRLLDGLLAEHLEEVRVARKKADAAAKQAEGDEEGKDAEATQQRDVSAAAAEPTSAIAPKLRAENASMGQVLLDLALAKTVVEESFESPASGAALVEQLLTTAGAFAFSREVVELIVSSATHKMLEACFAADGASTTATSSSNSNSGRTAASLSIVSQQQQLRVRVQWRHRNSVDTVLAAYLSLEDSLVNRYATAVVDATTYLADGGREAISRAHRRKHNSAQEEKATAALPYAEHSFANPSNEDRRRASVKALVAILSFAALPAPALAALPGVTGAAGDEGGDSTQRLPAVRQALTDILRRLSDAEPAAVSKVCAALLQSAAKESGGGGAATAAAGKRGDKKKAAAGDVADVARWVLQQTKLDKETQQDCVEAPKARVTELVEEVSAAASAAPPPASRPRTEATAADTAATPLLTWSVLQLERFLLADDRDVLRSVAAQAGSASPSSSGARSKSKDAAPFAPTPLTAEEVERFIVWWKEEEAQLQQSTIVSASAVAASEARRRTAVVELLQSHGLLPVFTFPKEKKSEAAVWAAAEAFLLNRATALQYNPTALAKTSATSAARGGQQLLPLSLWRIFSALETMVGHLPTAAPRLAKDAAKAVGNNSDSSSSSSDDDDDDDKVDGRSARSVVVPSSSSFSSSMFSRGNPTLASFAAAGLYFLSGVPQSALKREEEWVRLEGVTSLLRCRLASWLGRRVCTRDTVAEVLRGATAEAAEGWIADLQDLLVVAQRCQPLPRYAHTHCLLPFLEGVAVYRTQAAGAVVGDARTAVQAARDAHEALMQLYRVSQHPESFLPLVYDGTSARKLAVGEPSTPMTGKASTAAVQQANTEDWVAYVVFERVVAKDLLTAKTVVEQGRRFALSPQQFMVKLNSL